MGKIYEQLTKYNKKNIYPFHMPGHKRMPQDVFQGVHPYQVDYTEVDGLDDLHDPTEMFQESIYKMEKYYGTKATFYLVNGSTSGIMAAITATCDFGDTIIIGRNCHKSVYKAIELLGLHPIYIYPRIDRENGMFLNISIEKVKEIVDKYPMAKAILLTSPTYEGMMTDIKAVSNIINDKEMILIVDEAHGAHLPFGEDFPESAIKTGADLVIQSMHKTMPALTQTALLHICTDCIQKKKMRECIDYFETTSPSYLLTASLDDAFEFGVKNADQFHQYYCRLIRLKEKLKELKHLYIVDADDPGKIVISTSKTNMTGKQLYDILLKKYDLQMEMAQENYCLAMTSVCDTEEGFQRLTCALLEIDASLISYKKETAVFDFYMKNEMIYTPYEAKRKLKRTILLEDSIGKISGDYIYLYPPGIPIFVPGEKISKSGVQKIKEYRKQFLNIKGLRLKEDIYITVLEQ